jgi:DNA-binding FadR family transcriptional regulator
MQAMHVPLTRHFRPERIAEHNVSGTEAAHAKVARLVADGEVERARRAMTRHIDAYASYVEDAGLLRDPIVPRRPPIR